MFSGKPLEKVIESTLKEPTGYPHGNLIVRVEPPARFSFISQTITVLVHSSVQNLEHKSAYAISIWKSPISFATSSHSAHQ
jgi:hypothetical protein